MTTSSSRILNPGRVLAATTLFKLPSSLLKLLLEGGHYVDEAHNEQVFSRIIHLQDIELFMYLVNQGFRPDTTNAFAQDAFISRYPQTRMYFRDTIAGGEFDINRRANLRRPADRQDPVPFQSKHRKTELENTRLAVIARLKDDDICPVCHEELKKMESTDIVFWNGCAHMVCKTCKPPLRTCPMCRG